MYVCTWSFSLAVFLLHSPKSIRPENILPCMYCSWRCTTKVLWKELDREYHVAKTSFYHFGRKNTWNSCLWIGVLILFKKKGYLYDWVCRLPPHACVRQHLLGTSSRLLVLLPSSLTGWGVSFSTSHSSKPCIETVPLSSVTPTSYSCSLLTSILRFFFIWCTAPVGSH